jgi:hypothetical protein
VAAPSSLFKFMQNVNGGDRGHLHWGRADIDGAPFRGHTIPMAPEDELANRLTRVADPKNQIFDLSDPTQNRAYLDVLDKIVNGWGQLLNRSRRTVIHRIKLKETGEKVARMQVLMYVEWIEYFMEDGKPFMSQRPYIGRPNE